MIVLNFIFPSVSSDWERTSQHPINTRDSAVAALSDAQFVAPLVHTGDTLAPPPALPGQEKTGQKCFFYVFDYQTKDGDYPQVNRYRTYIMVHHAVYII